MTSCLPMTPPRWSMHASLSNNTTLRFGNFTGESGCSGTRLGSPNRDFALPTAQSPRLPSGTVKPVSALSGRDGDLPSAPPRPHAVPSLHGPGQTILSVWSGLSAEPRILHQIPSACAGSDPAVSQIPSGLALRPRRGRDAIARRSASAYLLACLETPRACSGFRPTAFGSFVISQARGDGQIPGGWRRQADSRGGRKKTDPRHRA